MADNLIKVAIECLVGNVQSNREMSCIYFVASINFILALLFLLVAYFVKTLFLFLGILSSKSMLLSMNRL